MASRPSLTLRRYQQASLVARPYTTLDNFHGTVIPVAESGESTAIGAAEWMEYVALFLNAEGAASTHIEAVSSRITAAAHARPLTLCLMRCCD